MFHLLIEPKRFSLYFSEQIERMTKVIYNYQKHNDNIPITDVKEFMELIESHDPKLKEFFDTLFNTMDPKSKNRQTQSSLKQKIMFLCYQMAALRNKQVSGAKTAIGLFLTGSGTSTSGVDSLANMGICSTYRTVYNKLEKIVERHEESVKKYIRESVCLTIKFSFQKFIT